MTVLDIRIEIDGIDDDGFKEIKELLAETYKDRMIWEISLLNID